MIVATLDSTESGSFPKVVVSTASMALVDVADTEQPIQFVDATHGHTES